MNPNNPNMDIYQIWRFPEIGLPPVHHPFIDAICHEINHPAMVPTLMLKPASPPHHLWQGAAVTIHGISWDSPIFMGFDGDLMMNLWDLTGFNGVLIGFTLR